MDYTVLTNLLVTGQLKAGEVEAVHKSALAASGVTEKVHGSLVIDLGGFTDETITIGGAEQETHFIVNSTAGAITVKNVTTDSGNALAAGKVALMICSQTKNVTKFYVLN